MVRPGILCLGMVAFWLPTVSGGGGGNFTTPPLILFTSLADAHVRRQCFSIVPCRSRTHHHV